MRRSILFGVTPPGRFVWDPATVDTQLADWGRLWASSSVDREPDLALTINRALERLPHRWLGVPIDPGKAKFVTFVLLFQRRAGLMAIDAWETAARGDPSGVAILSLAYDLAVPQSFTGGDFLAKAFSLDYEAGHDFLSWLNPPGAALGVSVVAPFLRRWRGLAAGSSARVAAPTPPMSRPDAVRQRRPRRFHSSRHRP